VRSSKRRVELPISVNHLAELLPIADEHGTDWSHPIPLRSWTNVPLIEMVPQGRRAEVQEIIDRDPDTMKVLRSCKAGIIDCWTAMEIFGLPDPFNPHYPGNTH
jgi:hypothetical protein